jgi:hypothetical protein
MGAELALAAIAVVLAVAGLSAILLRLGHAPQIALESIQVDHQRRRVDCV